MNIIKNRWFLVGSALVIGLIIGGGLTYYACTAFYTKYIGAVQRSVRAVVEDVISNEENEALIRFQEGSPIIGLYEQDRLINYLNRFKGFNLMNEGQYTLIIVTLETRKGILYEEMGDNQKASECFNNAAKKVRESNMNANADAFVDTLKSEFKKLRKGAK